MFQLLGDRGRGVPGTPALATGILVDAVVGVREAPGNAARDMTVRWLAALT